MEAAAAQAIATCGMRNARSVALDSKAGGMACLLCMNPERGERDCVKCRNENLGPLNKTSPGSQRRPPAPRAQTDENADGLNSADR